jgi:glutamyl-tRNA reductase
VARLHARADAIRSAELERALARLPDLTPHARAVISDLATRIVGKLLHEPSVMLKRDAEGANMALVVERLFALMEPDICGRDTEVSRHNIHQESKAS